MKIATETNFRSYLDDILTELRDKYPDRSEIEIRAMAHNRVMLAAQDGKFDTKLSDIQNKEVGEDES